MTHRIHGLEFPRGPGGGVLTWHERPLMAAQYAGTALGAAVDAVPAIVMQGGVVGELDFTLQTLELYRRQHPQARLVLSTWADADAAALQRAQALGVQVVLSDKPAFAGQQNINLQIVTAAAGVLAAQAAGATHVLKTRTDQRLCAPDLLAYLHTLQESFPLQAPGAQKARLLTASLNTFRYRMYGVTDMFLFGRTQDMVAYWTPPLDERRFDPDAVHFRNLREFAQWRVCEVYLCTEFLQRTGWALRWTLEDYWRLMAERFCVVDATSVDLLWPKYATREMRWTNYSEAAHPFTEIGFRDWLLMHHGLHRLQRIPEEILG